MLIEIHGGDARHFVVHKQLPVKHHGGTPSLTYDHVVQDAVGTLSAVVVSIPAEPVDSAAIAVQLHSFPTIYIRGSANIRCVYNGRMYKSCIHVSYRRMAAAIPCY